MNRSESVSLIRAVTLLVLGLIMSCTFAWPMTGVGVPVAVTIDGQVAPLDPPAVMIDGRVMVPMRGIFERFGARVMYDPVMRLITATRGGSQVSLVLTSRHALVNGATAMLDVPPLDIGGRVLVPLRFISEALGADVQWMAFSRTVSILSRTGGVDLPYPQSAALPEGALLASRSGGLYSSPDPNGPYFSRDGNLYPWPNQSYYSRDGVLYPRNGMVYSRNGVLYSANGAYYPADMAFYPGSPLSISLFRPASGGYVAQMFDLSGRTWPGALVRIRVVVRRPFLGTTFGVHEEEIMSGKTVADGEGYYFSRVDSGDLPSGTGIVAYIHSENSYGALSNEIRAEFIRE